MKDIIQLRHLLHAQAELSEQEKETNRIVNEWISKTNPDLQIEKIGGYGLAALYKGKNLASAFCFEPTSMRCIFRSLTP